CQSVMGTQMCGLPQLMTTRVYNLDPDDRPRANPADGPMMAASGVDAQLFDLGIGSDGRRTFVVAGGSAGTGGNRFLLLDPPESSPPALGLTGLHAHPAQLDGGAVLTAFEPDGMPSKAASVIVPTGDVVSLAPAPADVDGMRLVALEDGSVLAVGPS